MNIKVNRISLESHYLLTQAGHTITFIITTRPQKQRKLKKNKPTLRNIEEKPRRELDLSRFGIGKTPVVIRAKK